MLIVLATNQLKLPDDGKDQLEMFINHTSKLFNRHNRQNAVVMYFTNNSWKKKMFCIVENVIKYLFSGKKSLIIIFLILIKLLLKALE